MNEGSPVRHRRTQAQGLARTEPIPRAEAEVIVQPRSRRVVPPPQIAENPSLVLSDWGQTADVPLPAPARPGIPRWAFAVMALLLVAVLAALAVVGVRIYRAGEKQRAEERAERELAEERAKYKFLYRDLIEDYAAEQEIDPALVAAIIYHESRFRPDAESAVGARGLMQVMEATALWIAGRLDEEAGYSFERMYDAETNIRFGTWYLGYLSKMFGGDVVKIAAGYHAGQNAVSGWLDNPEYAPDGWTLEQIPYPDTAQYVERVVNAYAIYLKHYYPPETPAPDA